jgi:heme exporter protein A
VSALSFDRVRVEGVTKVFGRQRALGGVSLTLEAGRLCAVLGPNGAGKSTLLSIVSTLARPTAGDVHYGATPHHEAAQTLRGAVGLVAHDSFLYGDLSGRENLLFFERLYGRRDRAEALLVRVGLQEAADRPVRTYSRGMQQRLALARALVGEPSLLLLDEPFSGLDRSGVEALRALLVELRAAGTILVLVTHDFGAAAGLCDHVVVLRRGRLVLDERSDQPFAALDELYEEVGRGEGGAPRRGRLGSEATP